MKDRAIPTDPGTRRGLRARVLFASGTLVLALVAPAGAAAMTMHRDRTDNVHTFNYDGSNGEIGDEDSSIIITSGDKVMYQIFVRERKGDVGERLAARISLRLLKYNGDWVTDERIVYKGAFSFEITQNDQVVYADSRETRIVLKPRKGQHRAKLTFLFDLPTGELYSAKGRFSDE